MHTNRYKKGLVLSVAGALIAGSVTFLMQSSDMLMASIKITPKVQTSDVLKLDTQKFDEFIGKQQIAKPTAIPGITKLPRVDGTLSQPIEGPRLETRSLQVFSSAPKVLSGGALTLFAKLLDTNNSAAPATIRVGLVGGDGMLGTYSFNGYDRTYATSAVTMDHLCYGVENFGFTSPNNYLITTNTSTASGSTLGQVLTVPDLNCPAGYRHSGWYVAKFFAPNLDVVDQVNYFVFDLVDEHPLYSDLDVTVVHRGIRSEINQVNIHQLQNTVEGGQDLPVIVTVQDRNGYGISCDEYATVRPSVSSLEMASISGCHLQQNGYTMANSITMNNWNGETGLFFNPGQLSANVPLYAPEPPERATMSNMRLYSRGNVSEDIKGISGNQNILFNLGGGAYFMVGRANLFANGPAEFRLRWSSFDTQRSLPNSTEVLARYNVVPYSLSSGLTMTLPLGLLPRVEF